MAPLTFADTHNVIAFLTKSDASDGFDQIVDFLNAHTIQYALMVNPSIYVSYIKQFWALVSVKKTNDVVKLPALIDRKKVVITEDTIQQSLRLDDADGVDSLSNEVIFAELARMGYKKLPPNITYSTIITTTTTTTQTVDALESSMTLLNKLMETCATLTQKVANVKQDKVAQALEIVKLKQRVRKLEKKRRSKSSGLKRLRKVGEIAELDADEDVTLVDVDTAVGMDADTPGRMEEDVTAVKEGNAVEPTVFDDKEVRPIFKREYNHVETFLKSDRDEEPTKKRAAKETLLQESFKKLRAEVEVSGSSSTQQNTPTVDPAEISKEDVQNMLQNILMVEFKVEALQVKYPLIDWEIYSKGSRTY
nr:hypothetical protein [Tanacetum cinerariifolium]